MRVLTFDKDEVEERQEPIKEKSIRYQKGEKGK
jgi:hypothetical protein